MTAENGGSNFLVALAPSEVFLRADRYMLNRGFSVSLNRSATSAEYTMFREKGFLGRLLMMSPDFYTVRLSVRDEEGGGGTQLSVKTTQKGRWPELRSEIEQWITQELRGVPSPP
jgi:hypothetical protein